MSVLLSSIVVAVIFSLLEESSFDRVTSGDLLLSTTLSLVLSETVGVSAGESCCFNAVEPGSSTLSVGHRADIAGTTPILKARWILTLGESVESVLVDLIVDDVRVNIMTYSIVVD